MGIPQIIIIVLISLSAGINIAEHGKPKNQKFNIFIDLASSVILVALLWWGGFWTVTP